MDLIVKFHGSSWGCLKALHGSGGRWSSAAAHLEPWKHHMDVGQNPVPPVNLKVDGHPKNTT